MATCTSCGNTFDEERFAAGFTTCPDCASGPPMGLRAMKTRPPSDGKGKASSPEDTAARDFHGMSGAAWEALTERQKAGLKAKAAAGAAQAAASSEGGTA